MRDRERDNEVKLIRSYNEFMRQWEMESISDMPVTVLPRDLGRQFEVRREKARRKRESKARGNSNRLRFS